MTPDAHMVETLRLRTAALRRVAISNDLLRRENDDLRADKAAWERWRDQWIASTEATEAALAREEDRADAAEAAMAKVRALFNGGPDTPCRTTRGADGVECVEVPLADLSAVLDGTP